MLRGEGGGKGDIGIRGTCGRHLLPLVLSPRLRRPPAMRCGATSCDLCPLVGGSVSVRDAVRFAAGRRRYRVRGTAAAAAAGASAAAPAGAGAGAGASYFTCRSFGLSGGWMGGLMGCFRVVDMNGWMVLGVGFWRFLVCSPVTTFRVCLGERA